MKNLIIICFAVLSIFCQLSESCLEAADTDHNKTNHYKTVHYKIVGYYPNWAIYRNPSLKPSEINPSLITHLNYAFAKVDTSGNIILFDPWADVEYRSDWNAQKPYWGNFRELYNLKQRYPHLKTFISVGGWTLSDTFSEMAENPAARREFAKNAVIFCKQYDFDGIDIDWEYPGYAPHQGRPQDKENFTLLLQELHAAAKAQNPPLLVTIAAPAGSTNYVNMEVEKIHEYLDWINLMTYDLHGPWPDSENHVTNHLSALYPPKEGNPLLTVESAVMYYIEQGVPSQKLVLGMPLYGRSFAGAKSTPTGLFSTYSGPGSGTTQEVGMRFFYDIKQNLLSTHQLHWDGEGQVPYLHNSSTGEFITFDNETSLQIKCEWVKSMKLGGAMVWELGLDVRPTWDAMKAINSSLEE